jgi:hypothetical protein
MSHKRRYPTRHSVHHPLSEPLEPRRLLAANSYVIDTSNAVDLGTLTYESVIAIDLTLAPNETHKVFRYTSLDYAPTQLGLSDTDARSPTLHARFLADFNADGLIELNETFATRTVPYGGLFEVPIGPVYIILSESSPTLTGFANRDPAAATLAASLLLETNKASYHYYGDIPRTPTRTGTPGDVTETFDMTGEFFLNFAGTVSQENPHDRIIINIPPGRVIDRSPNDTTYAFGDPWSNATFDDPLAVGFGHYRTVDGVSTPIEFTNQNDRYDYSIISQANQIIIDFRFNLDWSTLTDSAAPEQGAAIYAVRFNLADVTDRFEVLPEVPNPITVDVASSQFTYFNLSNNAPTGWWSNLYLESNGTPGLQYDGDESNRGNDTRPNIYDLNEDPWHIEFPGVTPRIPDLAFRLPANPTGTYTFYQSNLTTSYEGYRYRSNTVTYIVTAPPYLGPTPSAGQPLVLVPVGEHDFHDDAFKPGEEYWVTRSGYESHGAFSLPSHRQNSKPTYQFRLVNFTSADLPISGIIATGDFVLTGSLPTSIPANSETVVTLTAPTKVAKNLLGKLSVHTPGTPVSINFTARITPPATPTTSDSPSLPIEVESSGYRPPAKPTAEKPFSKIPIKLKLHNSIKSFRGPLQIDFYLDATLADVYAQNRNFIMPLGEVIVRNPALTGGTWKTFFLQPPATPALNQDFTPFVANQSYVLRALVSAFTSPDRPRQLHHDPGIVVATVSIPATTTDLRPTLSAPKSLKLTGKPTSLKLTLENLGTSTLTDRITIQLFHSADNLLSTQGDSQADTLFGTFTFNISLAAGQKKTFTLRTTLPPIPPGQSFLLATATGLATDNNPNNNSTANNTATPAKPTLFRT